MALLDMPLSVPLLAVLALPLLLVLRRLLRARAWAARRDALGRPVRLLPKIPDATPLGIGTMLRFARAAVRGDELAEATRMLEESGSTCRLDSGISEHAFVLTGEPEVVAWVLARNFENYEKGPGFIGIFNGLLGQVRRDERASATNDGRARNTRA